MTNPLVDGFGRVHTNLRISVTDRCNIRCFYCMPEENVQFKPRHEILYVRRDRTIRSRVGRLGRKQTASDGRRAAGARRICRGWSPCWSRIEGIRDIALTTNGILLAEQAQALKDAGLHRLNISLDTL